MFNPQRNSSSAAEAVLAFPELLLWTSSVGGGLQGGVMVQRRKEPLSG